MAGIPEFCDVCGRRNELAPMIHVGEGTRIESLNLAGNHGRCPYCGGRTTVIEGSFNWRAGVIEVLTATDWTKARLLELQQALEDAQRLVATDVTAAVDRVAEVDERTAGLLRRMTAGWTREDTWKLIAALIAIMAIIVPATQKGSLSEEDVRRIVDRELERRLDDAPAPPSPLSPPDSLPPAAPTPPG